MKSCLVVDDSKVIRMVARRILEGLDFEITEAVDGKEALETCTVAMPDAVLLDWHMPIMNGIEFLRELRKTAGGDAPVDFLYHRKRHGPHPRSNRSGRQRVHYEAFR